MSVRDSVRGFFAEGGLPLRVALMALFGLVVYFPVLWLVLVLAVLQLVIVAFNGEPHQGLRRFGGSLSAFAAQCFEFLTFSTEELPFPFGDWPEAGTDGKAAAGAKKASGAKRTSRAKGSSQGAEGSSQGAEGSAQGTGARSKSAAAKPKTASSTD